MIEVIEKIGNIENLSLKNEKMEVVVSTFGCTIIKMIVEDKNGVKGDVVLGYDDFNQYQTLDGYLGALVGRVANRIGKGTFELMVKHIIYLLIMVLIAYMVVLKDLVIRSLIMKS